MGIWDIFFPTPLIDTDKKEIQPSYATMRQRDRVMRQIRESHIKLRRTFIIHHFGRTTHRGVSVAELPPLGRSSSDPSPIHLWYR